MDPAAEPQHQATSDPGTTAEADRTPPRTWLMLGRKAGDNGMITALADALGWPYESKRLTYRRTELLTNLFSGPTLAGLDRPRSSELAPPWPDLVISAGRRNEPLVRWIQREAGGPARCRLVQVGRPWALHACFDLIVTTPQYQLADGPNILQNEAPLHRVTPARLAEAKARFAPLFAPLPSPRVAVLLGGNAGPFIFDRASGALLGWHANAMAAAAGGSVLVTGSARTPEKALDALLSQLHVPVHAHRWCPDDPENPYLGMLAWADRLIVTADSMSMLIEACSTARPVFVFDFSRGDRTRRPPDPPGLTLAGNRWWQRLADWRPQPWLFRFAQRRLPKRLTRDVTRIHARQVSLGRAVWLGQPWPDHHTPPPLNPDLDRAVRAVRALFTPRAGDRSGRAPAPTGPPIMPSWLRRLYQ